MYGIYYTDSNDNKKVLWSAVNTEQEARMLTQRLNLQTITSDTKEGSRFYQRSYSYDMIVPLTEKEVNMKIDEYDGDGYIYIIANVVPVSDRENTYHVSLGIMNENIKLTNAFGTVENGENGEKTCYLRLYKADYYNWDTYEAKRKFAQLAMVYAYGDNGILKSWS